MNIQGNTNKVVTTMTEIKKKIIEIDARLPFSVKQRYIHTWTNDMIRNGIFIVSVKHIHTKDEIDFYEVEYYEG